MKRFLGAAAIVLALGAGFIVADYHGLIRRWEWIRSHYVEASFKVVDKASGDPVAGVAVNCVPADASKRAFGHRGHTFDEAKSGDDGVVSGFVRFSSAGSKTLLFTEFDTTPDRLKNIVVFTFRHPSYQRTTKR